MCFVCNVGFISKSNFGGSGPNKLTKKNNVGVILELFPQVIVEPWGQTNCQMCFTPGIYQLNIMYVKIGTQFPKPIQTQNE